MCDILQFKSAPSEAERAEFKGSRFLQIHCITNLEWTTTIMRNIAIKGLQELDQAIAEDWRVLSCREVNAIYQHVWWEIKELNGNAEGFVGLSEFVIVRFLAHMLGGVLPRAINKDLAAFQCALDGRAWLTHAVQIGRDKPDISLYWKDPSPPYWDGIGDVWAVVEVKLGLGQGILQQVNRQSAIFARVRNIHPKARCLLLLYEPPAKQLPSSFRQPNQDFLILWDNQELFWQQLYEKLGLARSPFAKIVRVK